MRRFAFLLCGFALLITGCQSIQTKRNLTTDFTLPNKAFLAIPFDGGERFIAGADGLYLLMGQVRIAGSCEGTVRSFGILKNGDEKLVLGLNGYPVKSINCEQAITIQVNAIERLQRGDSIGFYAYQDSGNPLIVTSRWCAETNCSFATWGAAILQP